MLFAYQRQFSGNTPLSTCSHLFKTLRSILFEVILYSVTIIALIIWLPLLVLPLRYIHSIQAFYGRLFDKICSLFLGLTYRIKGHEHIADTPVIYAIKHESAWDTLALSAIINHPAFVIKRELLFVPLFGWYMSKFQMIAVDRRNPRKLISSFLHQAKRRLEEGRSIIIFPEGKRVTHGDVVPLQSGIWMLYDRLKYPVIPVTLDSGKFWGRRALIKKSGCITLQFHPSLPQGLTKEQLLSRLQQQINTNNVNKTDTHLS